MDTRNHELQQLARRINELREERRRNDGRRVRITSAMSRILENDPTYKPYRPRDASGKRRPPAANPSIFTIQAIARSLGTTVGDLLGEASPPSPRDVFSVAERQTLRRLLRVLWRLFDLNDPALATTATERRSGLQ